MVLRKNVASDCLPLSRSNFRASSAALASGRRSRLKLAPPPRSHLRAQAGSQRIGRPALEPRAGDDKIAARRGGAVTQQDGFDRLALEGALKMLAPADQRAAIGRRQRGHRDAQSRRTRRSSRRPNPAAARMRRRAPKRRRPARARGSHPLCPRSDSASSPTKPSKAPRSKRTPCAASRASSARSKGEALKLLGNTRPLEPMKVSSPSSAQNWRSRSGGKARMIGSSRVGRRAVAREENLQRLAMRQIEPAAPGHQKFARGARLVVKDGDASARARQNIGGDEAGWAGADHGAERGGSGNLGHSSLKRGGSPVARAQRETETIVDDDA